MKMSASDHGRKGGRPSNGDLTRRLTAADLSSRGRDGMIQTTLNFGTTFGLSHPSIKNGSINIGGNAGRSTITVNGGTVNLFTGPVTNTHGPPQIHGITKEPTNTDEPIVVDSDGEEPRPGEKRPRPSSPETPVDPVLERLTLEAKVSKETSFESYDHHRKDVQDQLEKEEDNTRREALQKKLEELKIIWRNTCVELMESKKETHAPAPKTSTTLSLSLKIKSKTKNYATKVAPPILGQPYSEDGKSKRTIYSNEDRERCVQKYNECMASDDPEMKSVSAAVRQIRQWSGFKNMSRKVLREWITRPGGTKGKPPAGGRKVNREFYDAVLSKLIYRQRNSNGEVSVLANIAYSHAIIQKAALLTRNEPTWKDDKDLETRSFSRKWSSRFLEEMRMSKRRVTNVLKKNLPSEAEVLSQMKEIQERIMKGGSKEGDEAQPYPSSRIINCDETATNYSIQFQHQWVLSGTDRGSAPDADEKRRFTSMIGGTASGQMLPTFNIIMCTVKQDPKESNYGDLTRSTILNSIKNKVGFREDDGWESRVWTKSLPTKIPNLPYVTYKRPYLIHKTNGTVVTVHNNAWMDAPGLCMWADLVVQPWAKGERVLLVWDNCPSHKTADVANHFQSLGIELAFLPANMTDKLQPMDLNINGPLKAYMRRYRGEQCFDYKQQFHIDCDKALQEGNPLPSFSPPLPKVHDGLNMLLSATKEMFSKESFPIGLQKIFIKVGLARDPDINNQFRSYSGLSTVTLSENDEIDMVLGKGQAIEPTLGSLVFECLFSRDEAQGWLNEDIENYEIDPKTGLASASV